MAEFERGQTFLDRKATNISGQKHKYFIALSNADFEDDDVVCFVMNSEDDMIGKSYLCNKVKGKFILKSGDFSFIKHDTSIMLKVESVYTLEELLSSDVQLLDMASDTLQRQIKNCIDFGYLLPKHSDLIKAAFK